MANYRVKPGQKVYVCVEGSVFRSYKVLTVIPNDPLKRVYLATKDNLPILELLSHLYSEKQFANLQKKWIGVIDLNEEGN